jgi:hypothetical protein
MQTPPKNGQSNRDYRSPNGSLSRELFSTPNGTPKRARNDGISSDGEDAPGTPKDDFSLRSILSSGRGGGPVSSGPPPAPFKPRVKKSSTNDPEEPPSNALPGLPILVIVWSFICSLGAGSFGTVDKVVFTPPPGSPPGTPCSPPVAMKTVSLSSKQGPKALLAEAANLGSPGCASGVATTNNDGDLIIFTPVAVPLSKMGQIGYQLLEEIISLMRISIMEGPLRVILDIKLENLGIILKGKATVVPDEKGQPSIGPPTQEKQVVILDLGNFLDAEDTDGIYGVFLEEHDLATVEEQTKFREFKCEMMEALLRNQNAEIQEDEKWLVACICTKYHYRYAGGQQYQPDFQE